MGDGNFKFNSSNYSNLKDDDPLCRKCFQDIISKSDTERIDDDNNDIGNNNDRECCCCGIKWENAKFPQDSDVKSWAIFISDNVFRYGICGEFQVISEGVNFKKGNQLCNDCLKSLKYELYMAIECKICNKRYQSLGHEMEGNGCAATVYDTVISAGYGSKYDCMSERDYIKFTTERPKHLPHRALICDDCIDELIKNDICFKPISYYDEFSIPIKSSLPTDENMNDDIGGWITVKNKKKKKNKNKNKNKEET